MRDITELGNGYKMYQDADGFRFSVDPVILSDFYNEKSDLKILDIGTGNGIIPLLLIMKKKINEITGIEIQKESAELALENIKLNSCESQVRIVNWDVKKFSERNSYDVVISNPPYMEIDGKKINREASRSIARHEIALNLRELIEITKKLLKPRGSFYLVHRAHRAPEIMHLLLENGFSIDRVQFVHYKRGENANLVLLKACKGRKTLAKIEGALYLSEEGY